MTKPTLVWRAFDPKGKFALALPKRSAAAIEAGHAWASNDSFGGHPFGRSTLTLWEGARRSGWSLRRMSLQEVA